MKKLALLFLLAFAFAASAQNRAGNFLDLTGGYVETPHAADLASLPLTVTAWVRTTSAVAGPVGIVNKYLDGSSNGYSIHLGGGHVYAWYFASAGNRVYAGSGLGQDGGIVNDGAWHHVAYTVDAAGGKLYVDGVLKSTQGWTGTATATTSTEPLRLGRYPNLGNLAGQIDDITVWNIARTPSQIDASRNGFLTGDEAGLVAYYRCDESSGTAVLDARGGAHPAAINGSVGRFGPKTGNAIENSAILVTNNPGDLGAYPITLSAWFKTTSNIAATAGILTKAQPGTGNGYAIHLLNGHVHAYYRTPTGQMTPDTSPGQDGGFVADGAWHHVAYVVDASGGKLYVDGVVKSSLAWTGTPGATSSGDNFHIGSFHNGFAFTGQIDEAAVWNVARTAPQLALATTQRLIGHEAGLIAYFPFDEASGLAIDTRGTHTTINAPTRVVATASIGIGGRVTSGGSGLPGTAVVALGGAIPSTTVVPIPDVSTANSTLSIPLTETIGQVRVNVDIAHTFRGDLEITLIHPDGTQVRLKDADVDDDAQNFVTSFPAPTAPVQSLAALAGKPASGTWTLRVRDAFASDTGSIRGWSLAFAQTATTDVNGDYFLSNTSPQSYAVQPVRAGFVFAPESRAVASSAVNVDFALTTATITGRITANDVGLAGVTVNAGAFSAVTDANGNYIITGLPPGSYAITALLPGYGFVGGTANSALGDVVDFTTSTYPIAGRITDTLGGGVPGVFVAAAGGFSAMTDANGDYLIPLVTPGTRLVTPSKGGVVFLPATRNVTLPPAASGANFSANSLPPTITTVPDLTIARGTATGALRFTVDDVETRAGLLTVSGASNNPLLVPASAFAFSGVGTERTVTITPDPARSGDATITLTVTDEAGLTASSSFLLRVNVAPLAGVGAALAFNGGTDRVTTATRVIADKGNYTIECWAYSAVVASPRTLAGQGTNPATASLLGLNAAGTVQAGPRNTGVAFPFNAWHHIALVREPADTRLYLDGILRASRGSTIVQPGNSAFQIGANPTNAVAERWVGGIDEMRVWKVARTAAQVAANQNVRVLGADPDLAGLWRLDELTAPTATTSNRQLTIGAYSNGATLEALLDEVTVWNVARDAGQIATTMNENLTGTEPGLLAWYRFNESTGIGVVDSRGLHPGSSNSALDRLPSTAPIGGGAGNALSLHSAGSVAVNVPHAPDLNTFPLTVTAWIKTSQNDASVRSIVNKYTDGFLQGYSLHLVNGRIRGWYYSNAVTFLGAGVGLDGGAVADGMWHHIAFVVGRTGGKIYVDGEVTASQPWPVSVEPIDSTPLANHGTRTGTTRLQATALFPRYNIAKYASFTDTLQAYDAESDPLTFALGTPPVRGTVTITNAATGAFSYVPDPGAQGTDTFTFNVDDGTATSEAALVTVAIAPDTTPPTISTISGPTIAEDTATGPLAFTVGDAEAPVDQLTLSATSDSPLLVPAANIVFGGTGANRTVTVTPGADLSGTANITVTVSDSANVASRTFLLTVTPVPDSPTIAGALVNQTAARGVATLPQSFTIADVDTPVASLNVTAVASDPALIPTVTLGGAGASRTIAVTPSASQSGTATITVTVTDGASTPATASYVVTVVSAPSIAAVANQTGLSAIAGAPITITLSDADTPLASLTLTATASDPTFVPASGFVFGGSGANRTLVITPASRREGVVTITLTVSDGVGTRTTTFQLQVLGHPEFEYVELPSPGSGDMYPVDLNESGQIVGYAIGVYGTRSLLWNVNATPTGIFLRTDVRSRALAINNAGEIVGRTDLEQRGFVYRNGTFTTLLPGSVFSEAWDINESGAIVGGSFNPSFVFILDGATQTNQASSFGSIFEADPSGNDRGDIIGLSPGSTRAILWEVTNPTTGARTVRDLGTFGGTTTLRNPRINNARKFVVSVNADAATAHPVLYDYVANTTTDLGPTIAAVIPGASYATGINGSGDVVGTAAGVPFLYGDGRVYNLRTLCDTTGLIVDGVTAINGSGDIIGYGHRTGAEIGFLLRRKGGVDVAQPIAPPVAAINSGTSVVFRPPAFEATDGTTPEVAAQAFFWSPFDQRAYFLRPIVGRITWFTSADVLDPDARLVRPVTATWPETAQIHVATAPVQLDPLDAASPYRAVAKTYSTVLNSSFDVGTKTLLVPTPGYTVIQYLLAPEAALGAIPDATTHGNYFQVVRTVAWNDTAYLLDGRPATVGTKVTDPRAIADSPKSGWTVFERAPYDGAGTDKAYDRATQTGPIIPVNKDTAASDDDLAIAFYQRNAQTGVLWADKPVRFIISWPGNATPLVAADPEGSGPLSVVQFPSHRVYVQNDRTLPGFNPNEEHAFLAPASTGEGVFALRNDLNAISGASEPFVLLKYRDPATNEWRFKLYAVALEDADHRFIYDAEAGQELLPPYPVSLLPISSQSHVAGGDAFRDVRGKFYSRSGQRPGDPNPQILIDYSYPLQTGFFYDLNGDGVNDVPVGGDVPWNRAANTALDIAYRIHWPADAPVLAPGETLLTAKHGLPGIKDWANAQVLFDSLDPTGTMPLQSTARLYDPLSGRTLKLTDVTGISASYQFPAEAGMQLVQGKGVFTKLPFEIRSRLSYDPINKSLTFAGYLDGSVLGEPLLLTNVLTLKERDRIKQLSAQPGFQSIVDALYDLTRNPNGVNVAHPGDAPPDKALLIGFTTKYVTDAGTFYGAKPAGTILSATIVREPLGALPKALTAGTPTQAQLAPAGGAISLPGSAWLEAPHASDLDTLPLTVSAWIKTTNSAPSITGIVNKYADGSNNGYSLHLASGRVYAWYFAGTNRIYAGGLGQDGGLVNDGAWHQVTYTVDATGGKLYVDGVLKNTQAWTGTPTPTTTLVPLRIGRYPGTPPSHFTGQLDEVSLWNVTRTAAEILAGLNRSLTGQEPGLIGCWKFDDAASTVTLDSSAGHHDLTFNGTVTRDASTAPLQGGYLPRYLTLAENNDASLGALPVTLHIVQVGGAPFRGDVKIIFPDNVFDERLTLRHSSDFGGDPEPLEFEWWYHPDNAEFSPTALPLTDAAGNVTDVRGWIQYKPRTNGLNNITIGEGGDSSLFTLIDKWFIVRYRGYTVSGTIPWSPWVGDPSSTVQTRAAFAPGWIKRVIEGINPFEQRVKDFHSNAVNTYSSMLVQAGQRSEGPVALNPSGANLNGLGLIEIYSTVLDRGKQLSIDGAPAVDSDPANNALLLAASRVSDLYSLLGNEAYADALDPTIGYDTSGQFGSTAPSIFAFQNQLDSQLDEELALLRGRDDKSSGVGAAPVYNRLLWNFTGSDGEVAYAQCYNISDQNRDGSINEFDARIMFPQGHGDAWGHYLTALTGYYDLLRHPNFTWIPRPETTLIAGTAVQVDFLDERKFAKAAAAKARTGAQVVDLTYRLNYVDDPNGQFQGYKDTDTDRAWGVSEWSRRAGQGSYFDWVTANAILPSTDPNPAHTGIQKIDRQTVPELDEIIAQHNDVQGQLDKADAGLNPLGVAIGAVPFDIDPSKVLSGQTHFDQINARAVAAVTNTISLFNFSNQLSQLLRRNQDTQDQLATNTNDKERDLKNRMIELYGYPYAGDIGPAGTYPTGYDGPDLYHYMYVNPSELTGEPGVTQTSITGFFTGIQTNGAVTPVDSQRVFPQDVPDPSVVYVPPNTTFQVTFPFSTGDYGHVAPASYGTRRAAGKLQINLSDMLRAEAKLKQSIVKYDLLLKQIQDTADILEAQYNLNSDKIVIKTAEAGVATASSIARLVAKQVSISAKRAGALLSDISDSFVETIPKSVGLSFDAFSGVRGFIGLAKVTSKQGFDILGDQADYAEYSIKEAEALAKLATGLALEVEPQKYDVIQKVRALEQLIRTEIGVRFELFELKEALAQATENFRATLAQADRIAQERIGFRRGVAATTQQARYTDMAFRIFQNDALQKYRAQFDLAARYTYLAAKAYDYETCLLGNGSGVGQRFLTDIVRQRSLGQIVGGFPVAGSVGLADPLARLGQNFEVYRGQLGFNNPETETGRFSLRQEAFRIAKPAPDDAAALRKWRNVLQTSIVPDLWKVPEFRKYCRPFAPESAGPQPGLVIPFSTNVTFGLNYFGWPLGGGDNAYDPSRFATKVRSAGVNFTNYNGTGLSNTPRVYLVPVGNDFLRSPSGDGQDMRTFSVVDQKLPVPFPIGTSDLLNPAWIPGNDSLNEDFGGIRRYSSFRAYHDSGTFTAAEQIQDSRLIGRSVWNTKWLLIIPGGTFLNDPDQGLETFINSNTDIKIFFQTYSYSGN